MSYNDQVLSMINLLEIHTGNFKDRYSYEEKMYDYFRDALEEVMDEYFPEVDEEVEG